MHFKAQPDASADETDVAVGSARVGVGGGGMGVAVAVGGTGVAVGGTGVDVEVGGTGVAVGGTGVEVDVGGTGVGVGVAGAGVAAPHPPTNDTTNAIAIAAANDLQQFILLSLCDGCNLSARLSDGR